MTKEKTEKIIQRGNRKERVGTVVSDRQEKTIIVEVKRRTAHPLYKKVVKTSKRYVADDQGNEAAIGDKVRIIETRPLSKTKRWRLLGIISKAE
jgi:small subunit ribosomal protein S17